MNFHVNCLARRSLKMHAIRYVLLVALLWVSAAGAMAQQPDPAEIRSLAFSHDGKWLAIATSNSTQNGGVFVRDLESRQMILEQRNPQVGMAAVDFSVDGTLAVGQFAPTALLYDVGSGRQIGTLEGHSNFVRTLKFTSDGKRLITGSYDRTVKIWDVDARKEVASLEGHPEAIYSLSLTPDDSKLAVAIAKRPYVVWLWDLNNTQEPLVQYSPFGSLVPCVAIAPDAHWIAAASWDGNMSMFEMNDPERKDALDFRPGGGVDCVAFSHDQRWLVIGNGGLYVLDIGTRGDDATQALIEQLFADLDSDDYQIRVSATNRILDFGMQTLNELLVGLKSKSAEVRWRSRKIRDQLMSMKSARKLAGHQGERFQIAFSKDDSLMASGDNLGQVKIWDTRSWEELAAFVIQ